MFWEDVIQLNSWMSRCRFRCCACRVLCNKSLRWLVFRMVVYLLGNEKNLGWLGYIGDYTTQLYRDYNKTL